MICSRQGRSIAELLLSIHLLLSSCGNGLDLKPVPHHRTQATHVSSATHPTEHTIASTEKTEASKQLQLQAGIIVVNPKKSEGVHIQSDDQRIGEVFDGSKKPLSKSLAQLREDRHEIKEVRLDHCHGLRGLNKRKIAEINQVLVNGTEKLSLRDNEINSKTIGPIGHMMVMHRTLKKLDLGSNKIGDKSIEILAPYLNQSYSLEEFILDHNKLGHQGVRLICQHLLARNNKLTVLILNGNSKIGNKGAKLLSEVLPKSNNLQELGLGDTGIGKEGLEALLGQGFPPSLKKLDLGSNKISKENISLIKQQFSQSQSFQIKCSSEGIQQLAVQTNDWKYPFTKKEKQDNARNTKLHEDTHGNNNQEDENKQWEQKMKYYASAFGKLACLPQDILWSIIEFAGLPSWVYLSSLNSKAYKLLRGYERPGFDLALLPQKCWFRKSWRKSKDVNFSSKENQRLFLPTSFVWYSLLDQLSGNIISLPKRLWPYIPSSKLGRLDLTGCIIDNTDLAELADYLAAKKLVRLDLDNNHLSCESAELVLKIIQQCNIEEFRLHWSCSSIGHLGFRMLTQGLEDKSNHSLVKLDLSDMCMLGRDVAALAQCLPKVGIQEIDLRHTELKTLIPLARSLPKSQVNKLNLYDFSVKFDTLAYYYKEIAFFIKSLKNNKKLEELRLSLYFLDHIKMLAHSLSGSSLKTLVLKWPHQRMSEAFGIILTGLQGSQLEALELHSKSINDQSVAKLLGENSERPCLSSIQSTKLSNHSLSEEKKDELCDAYPHIRWEF